MGGRPAIAAVADIGGYALLAGDFEQIADEAGLAFAAVHLWQAHGHAAHTTIVEREHGFLRHAGHAGLVAHHVFGRWFAGRNHRDTRRDDERLVRAFENTAHRFDGAGVDLAVLGEFREIVDE